MTPPGFGRRLGAPGALYVGEKEFDGPGRTAFSVGAGAFVGVAGALEPGDFAGSAGFSFSVLHDASAPIPTTAAAPATKAIRLVKRVDNMSFSHFLYPIVRALMTATIRLSPLFRLPTPAEIACVFGARHAMTLAPPRRRPDRTPHQAPLFRSEHLTPVVRRTDRAPRAAMPTGNRPEPLSMLRRSSTGAKQAAATALTGWHLSPRSRCRFRRRGR